MASNVYSEPSIQTPTIAHLEEIAERRGLRLKGTEELRAYQKFMEKICDGINEVDKLAEPTLPVKYPRTPGHRPTPEENKLNGWYWKTDIQGAKSGKLSGKTVAIKDNIAVAGVPMMNGTTIMEGYVPEFDATVVTRVLDAGGRITGKATCEGFCLSANSYTCNKGPVLNFHNPLHSAGGSSGGSSTLVAAGEVDLAIGGDQGGSVRLPSCWCGVVGMKPSYGLVPYTGAMSIDPCLDHLGPIAKTIHDCALFLEVLAGYDNGMDPRQHPNIVVPEYSKESQVDHLKGLKIGLVKEGFGKPKSDPRVDQMVKDSVTKLTEAGAIVEEVSIPLHAKVPMIWSTFGFEGSYNTMIQNNSSSIGFKGFYPTSMSSFQGRSLRTKINDLSHTMKVTVLFGEYLKENYHGQFYSRGKNLARLVSKDYAEALEKYDVVAMPTIPFTALKVPEKDISTIDYLTEAFVNTSNTMAANITGLPALTVNAGFIDGLPVGAMFTGRMFDEVTVFKVGRVFEKLTSHEG